MSGINNITLRTRAEGRSQAFKPAPSRTLSTSFTPLGKLAEGGMGKIFFGNDSNHQPIIVKTPLPDHGEDGNHWVRQEAELMARFPAHPALPEVKDHGHHPVTKEYCLVMEYVDGEVLSHRLAEKQPSLMESIDIIRLIASGLAAAADHGFLHRDLKPDNIMIGKDGQVKILDWGLSQIEENPESVTGTPGYMSPEQINPQDKIDLRSDIYGLGVIFNQMINGLNPLEANWAIMSPLEIQMTMAENAQKGLPPIRLVSLDDQALSLTQEFVNKLTAYRREDRYQSYDEVIASANRIKERLIAFNAEISCDFAATTNQTPFDLERADTIVNRPLN